MEVRMDLRWSGASRRKTTDAVGHVTGVQVGVASGGPVGPSVGAEARRVQGGSASALAESGVSARVVRIGDDVAPRESANGRLRTPR